MSNHITVPTGGLTLTGPTVQLLVHQRGSLVATTKLLERQARTCQNEGERHWYSIATTVCAHAAVEAILNEWAEPRMDAATYKAVCREPVVDRAARLLLMLNGSTPPADLSDLSYFKNALCHAQPEHPRSGESGNWVTTDGAQRSLAVVVALQEQFFPSG
jgi:hypothetical protein